ncbi:MAG: putative Acyltransferase family protein [Promethearchaeota archaeon]|nr:MAG: putative Acyltransferase family protein [Candidatus Lokiarchaeota archaeon]
MGYRIGSIDIFRGFCIFLMFSVHFAMWWLSPDVYMNYFHYIYRPFGRPIAKGTGFILVSGASIALSYSNKMSNFHEKSEEKINILKNSSYIRAVLLFVIALGINLLLMTVDQNANIYDMWIVLTMSICLFFTWPLMKMSVKARMFLGIGCLIFNFFFHNFMINISTTSSFTMLLMDFFYPADPQQNPIIPFFPFFVFGTVLGSILSKIDFEKKDDMKEFLNIFTFPVLIISIGALIFGFLFQFPNYHIGNTTSFVIYSLGLTTLILSVLITIEKFSKRNFNTKYNPLFYFSYYSLTLFIFNYLFYPFTIIWNLDPITYWIVFSVFIVFLIVFLIFMYNKVAGLFSLKYFVSVMGDYISFKLVERKSISKPEAFQNLVAKLKTNIIPKNRY